MLAVAVLALATSTFIIEAMHRICVPAITVLFEALPPLPAHDRREFARVDNVLVGGVKRTAALASRTIVRQNESVEVRGWAFDPTRHEAAASVFLVVDSGPSFRATYGGDLRPAAERTAGAPAHTGFYGVVPTQFIALGAHVVHVRVVATNLSGYYDAGNPISLYVR